MLNQEKLNNSTFLEQTIDSTILDSGTTTTVCGQKWLNCFLETLPKKDKKIPTRVGTKTFKFGDGVKLKSLKTVILPCVATKMVIKIISDVVDTDIPLLLSKKAMKRAWTSLNFNNDTVKMFEKKKKNKLLCILSGHYHIPISRPPPDRGKFRYILYLNQINKKNKAEKCKNCISNLAIRVQKNYVILSKMLV